MHGKTLHGKTRDIIERMMLMKQGAQEILEKLFCNFPDLKTCRPSLERAIELLTACYRNGGKVLACGNGGSAADAEHIVGELMKGFISKRPIEAGVAAGLRALYPAEADYLIANLQSALPAIALTSFPLSSAFINDVASDMVFAQQVYGYGNPGDVLIGLSTSGNSKNVVNALKIAKLKGMSTIGLTGAAPGQFNALCDVTVNCPAEETYRIQEFHLPVYHALCAMLEAEFFGAD